MKMDHAFHLIDGATPPLRVVVRSVGAVDHLECGHRVPHRVKRKRRRCWECLTPPQQLKAAEAARCAFCRSQQ